jgi:protein TonB
VIRSQSRSVGGVSPAWFYFLSILVHVCILLLIIFFKDHRPKGFPSATTVTLVSQDEVKKTPSPPTPSKPHPLQKPVEQKKSIAKKIPVHKNAIVHVRTKPHPVIHKVIPPKKHPAVHKKISKLVKKSKPVLKKKAQTSHKSAPKKNLVKPLPSKSRVENAKPNPVKMDIQGQAFPTFLEHLLISRIKSNWFPPPNSQGLRATVRFVLLKNGSIKGDPEVITGSGSSLFDEAAKMSVLRSVPFPPMPPSFRKDEEVVTVTLEATSHGDVFDGN